MNKFWFLMMIASFSILIFVNPSIILGEMISATTSVLSLCFELLAVYTVWLGMLELIDKSGLGNKIAKLLRPFIRKILKIEDEETQKIVALNLSANILGLGNAATPAGIKAMERLDSGNGIASASMIMLIVLNVTSLQLLPTTIIGMRESAGSASASDIIFPTMIATIVTTLTGVVLAMLCEKIRKRKRRL